MTAECESTAPPPLRRPEVRCDPAFILVPNILAEGSRTLHPRNIAEQAPDFSQKNRGQPKVPPCQH